MSHERKPEHVIKVETNSAGYIWVCSCGKVWAYGMHNLAAVNAHTGKVSNG